MSIFGDHYSTYHGEFKWLLYGHMVSGYQVLHSSSVIQLSLVFISSHTQCAEDSAGGRGHMSIKYSVSDLMLLYSIGVLGAESHVLRTGRLCDTKLWT